MKIAKPHFYGALGIVLFAWLFFGLSWRNPAESANVPVLPERRSETANTGNPPLHDTVANQVRDKIATTNGIKNVSRQTTPSVMLVARMGNAGNSTVQAALETELYALRQGDPDLVASIITFDPADEPKIVDLLSVVPLETRKQYPTPERLVAFLFMGGQRMERIEVLAETPPRDDIVVQHVRFKFIDDPTIHDENLVFSHDSGGWKSVVPLGLVKRLTDAMKSAPSK